MFKLNLKIALRNLWKYRGYTAINIFGLSIGLASCILIFIFVNFQLSFDKDYANSDRIYRVVTDWKYADGFTIGDWMSKNTLEINDRVIYSNKDRKLSA